MHDLIAMTSGSTLSHAAVSTVDDISEPRVCASCSFTKLNDSIARGCTVELQNDEFTFVFNMSRQSSEELMLLECFPVQEAGVFSVSVYEVDHDGMVGHNVMILPDIDVTTQPNVHKTAQSVSNGMITVMLYMIVIIIYIIHSSSNWTHYWTKSSMFDNCCDDFLNLKHEKESPCEEY